MRICFIFILSILTHSICFADVPPDLQKIISSKKIVIAMYDQDYPPFFYKTEKGTLDGLDIAMANDMAKKLGVTAVFDRSAKSFDDVVKQVEHGNADIGMGALSVSLDRGLFIHFSDPYLTVRKVLIINRIIDLKIENGDLEGIQKEQLKYAVIKNSSYEKSLSEMHHLLHRNITSEMIAPYDNQDAAFENVLHGKIYAFYTDEANAADLLEKNRSATLFVKSEPIPKQFDDISVAVSWKNQNLLDWINLYIQSIKRDSTEDLFAKKYLKGS